MKKVIAIIPARGGSKKIPNKNIVNLCGKPLIAYSILIAKKTKSIHRIIVDTDDQKIARIAQEYGAEIPYLRPKKLAEDLTPDLPVFQHALNFLTEQGEKVEAVFHLRPTSPYRTVKYLEKALKIFRSNKKITCIRSVMIPDQNPYKMWTMRENGFLTPLIKTNIKEAYNLPRQKLPLVYWQIGNIDLVRPEIILKQNSMTGNCIKPLIMEEIFSTDIDTSLSLKIAETVLKPYLVKI